MADRKPKIIVAGSSHAKRVGYCFQKIPDLMKEYDLRIVARSGATYENMVLPNVDSLTDKDYLIIQVFGNNFLQKGTVETEYSRGKRKFILKKYDPIPEQDILQLFMDLKKRLENTKTNVLILDSPHRHLTQSSRDTASKVFKLFRDRNRLLKRTFHDSKATVIDHRYLMGVRANLLRTLNFYKSVLLDDVHFYSIYYRNLAANLYWKVIKGKRS